MRSDTSSNRQTVIVLRSDSGGRDSRLQKELRMFVEAGFEVTFLGWDRARECPKREDKAGYRIHRCHIPAAYGSRSLFLMMPLWWVYTFVYLLFHRADAVHACDFDTVVPALAARLFTRIPVVYDIYDFYSVKSSTIPIPLKRFFRFAEQVCARRANAVIIVDPSRAYLFGSRPPATVTVAMNCPYDQAQPDWTKPEGGLFTIFYGGAIAKHRGIEKLIHVTQDLDGVCVKMAGWITQPSLKTLIEQAPQVEYLGLIDYDAALRLTYESDAVYSYYDPELEINRTANSSKMYDAFMCSTPVLANSEPPAAQVIAEHDCGALHPYVDDDALANTIAQWRDNRDAARQLGANGRRIFENELNWETSAGQIINVYRDLGILKS